MRSIPDSDGFTQSIDFSPAYNLGPKYGFHNMELMFALIGPQGAVNLTFYTHWYLEKDQENMQEMYTRSGSPWRLGHLCGPEGTDVGIHRRIRDSEYSSDNCKLLDGETCYYDGTSTWAKAWEEGFVAGGEPWLWPRMRALYEHWFNNGPIPDLTPEYRQPPKEGQAP